MTALAEFYAASNSEMVNPVADLRYDCTHPMRDPGVPNLRGSFICQVISKSEARLDGNLLLLVV